MYCFSYLRLEKKEFAKKKALNSLKNPTRKDQQAAWVIDVDPVLAASGKKVADVTKEYTENSIKYQVEAAYYNLMLADKSLEVSQASLKRAQEQLKQAQAKFKAGTVAKIDVISSEAQLKSAEAEVNAAEATMEKARMALILNNSLNLDPDTPLKLADKFSFEAIDPIAPEKVFEEMTEKDLTYVSARENHKGNQVTMDYYNQYYTKNTFDYRSAAYSSKEAEVNFNNAQSQLKLNINSAYLDLKTAENNYQVLTKSLEQAQEAYRLIKLRYDVGMVTGYDVLNAETALKQADMGLLNALYAFNLAKAKFRYGIF